MTDHRSDSNRPPTAAGAAPAGQTGGTVGSTEDAVGALVRAHGATPPYDSVDWNSLAVRVVDNAQSELKRRQNTVAARLRDGTIDHSLHLVTSSEGEYDRVATASGGWRIRRQWFEVTAGWVRPAMIAAGLVMAVATTLTVTTPASPAVAGIGDSAALASASTGAYGVGDRDASDSAMEAAVVGRAGDMQVDMQFGPGTRDALFTAVVEGR
jgi:hypothetical protein